VDVYSVSGCISKYFCEYTDYWKHNGFGCSTHLRSFASWPSTIQSILREHGSFTMKSMKGHSMKPDTGLPSTHRSKRKVVPPETKLLEGYDVVTFYSSPECSPLSRCSTPGGCEHSERGPYRIFAVYSV
jgi:hypothetical protein